MKATEKNYRIVAACDPYNARKHYNHEPVLKYDGQTPVQWVFEDGLTKDDANARMLELARVACGRYIPNWGLAVNNAWRYGIAVDCKTDKTGMRSMNDDTMSYWVEEIENK